ncbi:MAG: hypothetical protein R6V47_05735 [Candidatus Delongbacteria bacterium]
MKPKIEVNGRKVTNPMAIIIIGLTSIIFTGLITALIVFLILPFVGVVLSLSVGLTIVIFIAIGVGLPILILGRLLLRLVMKPFIKEKKPNDGEI